MTSGVAVGRARSDLDVISRAGLPLLRFMDEAAAAMAAVVPFIAGCFSTVDPATAMISSTLKLGDIRGRNESDVQWAQIEYGGDDPTAFTRMLAAGRVALGVAHETSGDVERSVRMADLLLPRFGYHDEARVLLSDRSGAWGSLSVFRGGDDPDFAADELAFLETVAPSLTRGIRAGLLTQLGSAAPLPDTGPAVIVVDVHDAIVQASPGAESHLRRMTEVPHAADPLLIVQALVAGARRFARGDADRMPRVRARTTDGVWIVLHAAPLGGAGDRAGDVVVTIEEARPQEVIDLIAAAFGLTARERDVVEVLLSGADTREIAAALHVSPYTVQDHLKSIFDKAGVASRRELVARVYFDQYVTRIGAPLSTGGAPII